ncbi:MULTISPECIES: ABC transporter ATP-binding protein [Allobacillus]|uniref:ABC transporter ATP-binding protein n=1 Tax=Allobacillus salarius TaxID=1955272 RepID=A0A556PL02_9BACI|nr:ATP-binding cassette domain-containing protein [Allobacillus salarius]TSJ65070.1 ABC transporter ATP-binding protein [Allobacillus salarius]
MNEVLSVKGLGKSFKNTRVVKNIDFDVHKGEIMAVLGPNGAGKSTTIRSIMGILLPDEGSVTFHNHDQDGVPRHKIGYLPEERGLYKKVKVMDILLYFAELKDYPLDRAKERALEYLKKFDLEGKENVSVDELSKGMGQKVQFIGSVIHEPELLILDEPFSGLDPVSQEVFKQEIKDLAKKGTAILLSSHQMNLVEEMCDRLFLIHRGQKVVYGSMDEVKEQYANFKCTIHGDNDRSMLEKIDQVERVEQKDDISILYLSSDVVVSDWIKQLPSNLDIQELSVDRISLHEIFVDIATDRSLAQEAGVVDAK